MGTSFYYIHDLIESRQLGEGNRVGVGPRQHDEELKSDNNIRDVKWTESIAVGSEAYVKRTKEELGYKGMHREVYGKDGNFELKESAEPYKGVLELEKPYLRQINTFFWIDYNKISI